MTDLHTHILPGIDDGAKNVDISLQMLSMQVEQGVNTVVLTPHCYRDKERPEQFLARRSAAFETLGQAISERQAPSPRLLLGAEVAWVPHLDEWDELPELCIQGTHNMLLELPFYPWSDQMIDQLYDLMGKRGIVPIFAHLERYISSQRSEHIQEIISLGTPIQLSSAPLLHFWNRKPIVRMLRSHCGHLLASDCHNVTSRPPNLQGGFKTVERLLGKETAERLSATADRLAGVGK